MLPLETWGSRRISVGLRWGNLLLPRKDNECKAPGMLPMPNTIGQENWVLIFSQIKSLITKPSARRGKGATQEGDPDHFSWSSQLGWVPVPSSCPRPLYRRPADPTSRAPARCPGRNSQGSKGHFHAMFSSFHGLSSRLQVWWPENGAGVSSQEGWAQAVRCCLA